jgi:hypothetical protein
MNIEYTVLEEKISDKLLISMDMDKLVKVLMTMKFPRPHKREIFDPTRTSYVDSEYKQRFLDYPLIPLDSQATE